MNKNEGDEEFIHSASGTTWTSDTFYDLTITPSKQKVSATVPEWIKYIIFEEKVNQLSITQTIISKDMIIDMLKKYQRKIHRKEKIKKIIKKIIKW